MRKPFTPTLVAISLLAGLSAQPAHADVRVGAAAPSFTATDSNNKAVSLADYKGKFVVLEWTNDGCPFVQHYYKKGDMQALQKEYTGKGVVWLTVISSEPGAQGYADGKRANQLSQSRDAHPTAVLLDPAGSLGHLYNAKTTPDMDVIDPAGTLIYSGAIDSEPSTDPTEIAGAKPYVKLALDEAMAGKPVSIATSTPYGCSIKYQ